MGDGWTTNIPPNPTTNRETMNISMFMDADWMIVAMMMIRIPDSKIGFRPYLSENQPTSGKAKTEPRD